MCENIAFWKVKQSTLLFELLIWLFFFGPTTSLSVSFFLCRVSSERGSSRYCFWSWSRSKSLAVQFVAHYLPVSPVAEAAVRVGPVAGGAVGPGVAVVVEAVGVGVVDTAAVDVLGLGLGLPLAQMVGIAVGVGVVGGVAVVVDAIGHGVVREAAGADEGGVSLSLPLAIVVGIAVGVGVGMAVAVVVDAVGHGVVDSVDSGAVDKGGVSLGLS